MNAANISFLESRPVNTSSLRGTSSRPAPSMIRIRLPNAAQRELQSKSRKANSSTPTLPSSRSHFKDLHCFIKRFQGIAHRRVLVRHLSLEPQVGNRLRYEVVIQLLRIVD